MTEKMINSGTANTNENDDIIHNIKVIGMGPSKSGKTCVIKRYCENRFVPKYIPTIGIDYGTKQITIKTKHRRPSFSPSSVLKIDVHFWDFSGNKND